MTMTTNTAGEDHLPKPGEVLNGKYRIEKLIGKGGMGAVLSAHHELLGERVAIKFLLGEIAHEPRGRRALPQRSEERVQDPERARLPRHRRRQRARHAVHGDGVPRRRGPLADAREARRSARRGRRRLRAPGARGDRAGARVRHRPPRPEAGEPLPPAATDGSAIVKVLDFGIAKANTLGDAGGNHNLTSTKSMLGSPLYMSPEQLRRRRTSTRAPTSGRSASSSTSS